MFSKQLLRFVIVSAALVGLGLLPGTTRADIQFTTSFGDFQQNLPSGVTTDNVLFNQGLTTSGFSVQGETQSGLILNFTSTTELQVNSGNGGQAKIDAFQQNGTYTDITIVPANSPSPPNTGTLAAMSFNVQTTNSTDTFKVSVTTNEPGGGQTVISQTYTASNGNGEVGLIALNGESIASVTVNSLTGSMVGIDNTGEYRIAAGTPVVPEPSTIALALSGLVSFGLVRLRRFRRAVA